MNKQYYYHYTTPSAAEEIWKSGVIRKSTKKARRRDDARYGVGVYLTQFPPTASKQEIALNNYDGRNLSSVIHLINRGKVDVYIRLLLNPWDVVECEDDQGRDIFLYPDHDLHITQDMKPVIGQTS